LRILVPSPKPACFPASPRPASIPISRMHARVMELNTGLRPFPRERPHSPAPLCTDTAARTVARQPSQPECVQHVDEVANPRVWSKCGRASGAMGLATRVWQLLMPSLATGSENAGVWHPACGFYTRTGALTGQRRAANPRGLRKAWSANPVGGTHTLIRSSCAIIS
jgi:hypothetical protein